MINITTILTTFKFMAVAAIVAIAAFFFIQWKNEIKNNATNTYKIQQLEQILKEKDEYISNQKAINENTIKHIEELNKEKEELNNRLKELDAYIESENKKKSNQSSEILKRTIRELSK